MNLKYDFTAIEKKWQTRWIIFFCSVPFTSTITVPSVMTPSMSNTTSLIMIVVSDPSELFLTSSSAGVKGLLTCPHDLLCVTDILNKFAQLIRFDRRLLVRAVHCLVHRNVTLYGRCSGCHSTGADQSTGFMSAVTYFTFINICQYTDQFQICVLHRHWISAVTMHQFIRTSCLFKDIYCMIDFIQRAHARCNKCIFSFGGNLL